MFFSLNSKSKICLDKCRQSETPRRQKGITMPKGITNPQRKNGKAWKKKPKVQRKTGKTIGGYSLAKLAKRAERRK